MIGEYAQRCWNVLRHHVEQAHAVIDVEAVKVLSVDEVAKRRGHDADVQGQWAVATDAVLLRGEALG